MLVSVISSAFVACCKASFAEFLLNDSTLARSLVVSACSA